LTIPGKKAAPSKQADSAPKPKTVVVAAPVAPPPPPSGNEPAPRPAAEPKPKRKPVTPPVARSEPETASVGKPLEAASKYVGSNPTKTIGLIAVILGIGGALAILIKIELGRMLASPRRLG
jgi:hypothetical protein